MDTFLPGSRAPSPVERPLWIVFREEQVFVEGDTVVVESLDALGLAGSSSMFIGTFGGRPVFVVEASAPDPRFVGMRAAIMTVRRDLFALVSAASQLLRFERTHAFCGRCGTKTADRAGERSKECPVCALNVYPPISPAAIVLVHDAGRVLLAHRPKMPFFALVAGFVESGESLEECVAREVNEEIGVRVERPRYFGSQPWPFPHQLMVGFFARWAGGEIAVDGVEVDEARWFPFDALPALPPPVSIARAMIDAFVDHGGRVPGSPE